MTEGQRESHKALLSRRYAEGILPAAERIERGATPSAVAERAREAASAGSREEGSSRERRAGL